MGDLGPVKDDVADWVDMAVVVADVEGLENIVMVVVDGRPDLVVVNRPGRAVDVVGMVVPVDRADQAEVDHSPRGFQGIGTTDQVVDHHAEVIESRSLDLLRRMDYVARAIDHR